jgi:hypothetical protein
VRRLALAAALALASQGGAAQALYKCTGGEGRVTYQDTPCAGERSQKRIDPLRPESPDEADARRLLEREYRRGDELAGRFAREARELEIERQREAQAREERLRRMRERENRPVEEIPWDTPWGFPGKPGQARPQAKPAS